MSLHKHLADSLAGLHGQNTTHLGKLCDVFDCAFVTFANPARHSVFLFVLLFVASLLPASSSAATPEATKIFYGGFAFAGNASEIGQNYPIAAALDADHFFEIQSRDFLKKNAQAFKNVSVLFDIARPEVR